MVVASSIGDLIVGTITVWLTWRALEYARRHAGHNPTLTLTEQQEHTNG